MQLCVACCWCCRARHVSPRQNIILQRYLTVDGQTRQLGLHSPSHRMKNKEIMMNRYHLLSGWNWNMTLYCIVTPMHLTDSVEMVTNVESATSLSYMLNVETAFDQTNRFLMIFVSSPATCIYHITFHLLHFELLWTRFALARPLSYYESYPAA